MCSAHAILGSSKGPNAYFSTMQAFIDVFKQIDKDNSGEISIDELIVYQESRNLKSTFVDKWKRMFDSDNTGIITYEHFCEVLGIRSARLLICPSIRSSGSPIEAHQSRQVHAAPPMSTIPASNNSSRRSSDVIEPTQTNQVHAAPIQDLSKKELKVLRSNLTKAEESYISERLSKTYWNNIESPNYSLLLSALDKEFGAKWSLKQTEKDEEPPSNYDKYIVCTEPSNEAPNHLLLWRETQKKKRQGSCLFCCM
ncbi:hypothetical protein Ciccas_008037 [Cichlidogyrus casuarinus]|uniref:EF-hand domain-containing protein n=1 Tax=Cichlidogyrus casuarinus TaxID=1844966 RepID=A0ABD2Q3Q9_9PLAT